MASYVYRQLNKVTGEYYIGKGTYSSKDPDGSRYLGSGILFLRKYKAHPQDFEKEILKDFEDEGEAYAYERELIGEKYIGGAEHDLLCLNMNAGGRGVSSSFMVAYYKVKSRREERGRESRDRWKIRLIGRRFIIRPLCPKTGVSRVLSVDCRTRFSWSG